MIVARMTASSSSEVRNHGNGWGRPPLPLALRSKSSGRSRSRSLRMPARGTCFVGDGGLGPGGGCGRIVAPVTVLASAALPGAS